MTEIVLPKNVTEIGANAFENCTGLTDVVLPDSLQTINAMAFQGCSGLTRIILPQKLTAIMGSAFKDCGNLKTIVVASIMPPTTSESFNDYSKKVYVRLGTKGMYLNPMSYPSLAWWVKLEWQKFGESNIVEFGDVKDGEAYNQDFSVTSKVRYTRYFKNTNWQPLYVPFAIPVDALTSYGLKLAYLKPTCGDEEATVEFLVASGGIAKPNTPYLIKSEQADTTLVVNFPSVAIEPACDNSISCHSATQKFTFVGASNGVTGEEMFSQSYYAMAGGQLCQPQDNTVFLKPQRWYMKVENMDGTPAQQAATIRFVVSEEEVEDAPTAIESIDTPAATDDAFYNIEGRRTATPAQSGLFIHQGKILLIRK
ncbi:MAG: leucine-rich repeat domain-containing protein [Bacteroidales bacterium]|nr:leucine-rich repeat domain-containing protein [Bacteroidales bacterium]